VSQARRRIHDNDIETSAAAVAEYPTLLSWRADETTAGCSGWLPSPTATASTRPGSDIHARGMCKFLIDAGPSRRAVVCDGLIVSRTKGLLDLFHRRGLLPQSLRFFAALGDVNGVRACLDAHGDDLAAVNKAFMCALPSPARDRSGAAAGSVNHARCRDGKADRWRAGTFRICPIHDGGK